MVICDYMQVIISLVYSAILYMIQYMYKRMFSQVYTCLYNDYTLVYLYSIVCYDGARLYDNSTIALYASYTQAVSYPQVDLLACG